MCVLDKSEDEYADVKTVNWVESFLQGKHASPFFLAAGTFRPHLPWYAPQTYFDQYPMESVTLPPMLDNDLEDLPRGCSRLLVDIYPTFVELCNLSSRDDLDGQSLIPLLAEPNREWNRPSVTTFLRGNHAARSERWRYIRYSDGGEELYDHGRDPNEFHNLSDSPEYRGIKEELVGWFPEKDALDAPAKRDYDFNYDNYTWKRKTAGE